MMSWIILIHTVMDNLVPRTENKTFKSENLWFNYGTGLRLLLILCLVKP